MPEDRDENPVRSFGVLTSDLKALCEWLKRCQTETVAMESTGVYWIPLFQMLERNGLEVRLVNASHAKNVPGRKSDVKDCQWLQQLHTLPTASITTRSKSSVWPRGAVIRRT